jgi:membrane protein
MSRRPASPFLPLLVSAALIGGLLADEVLRIARQESPVKANPATGAFGTARSSDEPRYLQHLRAREFGRGREAEHPLQIPWTGWKDILWRSYAQISEDRLLAVAAGVVFYGLLAIFPAVAALVSLYGLFASPAAIGNHLSIVAGILPQGAFDILQEQIGRLTTGAQTKLSLGFVFGLAVALWSANAGIKAIMDALNVVYEEKEKRSFVRLNLISLVFKLAAIGSAFLALGAVVILPLTLDFFGLQNMSDLIFRLARWPVLFVAVILGLAVLYRYGPSRRQARWQWISIGSVIAAVAWLIASTLLSWYLASFADYNKTYGSLGAAIGMMMWMWVSAIVILLGAQLNSEIEHQTARDSIVYGDKPLGARGAVMADTIGKAP